MGSEDTETFYRVIERKLLMKGQPDRLSQHSHLCLFTDQEAVFLQNFHQGQFDHHQSQTLPQTVPRSDAPRQVGVRVDSPLVLLAKPV